MMFIVVTPAKAGVQKGNPHRHWIPAPRLREGRPRGDEVKFKFHWAASIVVCFVDV